MERQLERQFKISISERPFPKDFLSHVNTIREAGRRALTQVLNKIKISLPSEDLTLFQAQLARSEELYYDALRLSYLLSNDAVKGKRYNPQRSVWFNQEMAKWIKKARGVFTPQTLVWQLNGILLLRQRACLKEVYNAAREGVRGHFDGIIHDLLGSATSLNLGAEFPYAFIASLVSHLDGKGDNFCLPYHPGIHQIIGAEYFRKLYPNPQDVYFFSESSGTAVNSVAIEAVCSYGENVFDIYNREKIDYLLGKAKKDHPNFQFADPLSQIGTLVSQLNALGYIKIPKVLQIEGTWCGGFGTAKEGTGFGVSKQPENRGGSKWVDKCLPLPTAENKKLFLSIVKEKISSGEAAGVFLEPIVGDAGIVPADYQLVRELIEILKEGANGYSLPIIIDTVQQGTGRTGNYWGIEHLPDLKNYPYLVLTTAKSASNGQPYGMMLMPKPVAEKAYPLSMITTNSGNGGLVRAMVVGEFVTQPKIQAIIDQNAQIIDEVADQFGLKLRGLRMNRGIETGSKELMELIQWHLFIKYGVLVGALPATVRFQPMLLEHPQTIRNITTVVCRGIREILENVKLGKSGEILEFGTIPEAVVTSYQQSKNPSGLNR